MRLECGQLGAAVPTASRSCLASATLSAITVALGKLMWLKCRTKSGVLCPVALAPGRESSGQAMVCCVSDSANCGTQGVLCDIHDTQTVRCVGLPSSAYASLLLRVASWVSLSAAAP